MSTCCRWTELDVCVRLFAKAKNVAICITLMSAVSPSRWKLRPMSFDLAFEVLFSCYLHKLRLFYRSSADEVVA